MNLVVFLLEAFHFTLGLFVDLFRPIQASLDRKQSGLQFCNFLPPSVFLAHDCGANRTVLIIQY